MLLDDGRILVTGGRQSPYHPQTEYLSLSIEERKKCHWANVPLIATVDTQLQRWRHTANTIIIKGSCEHHIVIMIIIIYMSFYWCLVFSENSSSTKL